MKTITVLKGGALTTIQDSGRYHYQAFGLTVGGVMDDYAYRIANWLVGNNANAAVLEITLIGPKLQFNSDCVVAISGAQLGTTLNGEPIENWCSHTIKANDIISFSGPKQGCRAYLAVAGGIAGSPVLGSRSTDLRAKLGGIAGRALQTGDCLPIGKIDYMHNFKTKLAASDIPSYSNRYVIDVIYGPQLSHFTKGGISCFYNSDYTIESDSNRMGYRLAGAKIETIGNADIISDATVFGSIQVTSSGQPMILMADRQTSGGYAKIATVISSDLPKLAQAKPNDHISFRCIDIKLAQRRLHDYHNTLMRIKNDLCEQFQIAYSKTSYYNIRINQKNYRVALQELTKRSPQ